MPSQWGSVHLFDLCLRFGHVDTALALVADGVEGCKLEERALPCNHYSSPAYRCKCEGWQTCSRCCWGFPVDNGIWMKDWDGDLKHAKEHARKDAKTPLVRGILEIFSSNEASFLAMADEAAARLLDIAILCGNTTATANLAKSFPVRPLRRWRAYGICCESTNAPGHIESQELPVLFAALLAGADFQDLIGHNDRNAPLLMEVALTLDLEQWQLFAQFFESKPRWPTKDVVFVEKLRHKSRFLSVQTGRNLVTSHPPQNHDLRYNWVSMEQVLNGLRSGWKLKHMYAPLRYGAADAKTSVEASLLDLAILCGNPDCAYALADAGVELREDCLHWLQRAYRGDNPFLRFEELSGGILILGSAAECWSAAAAAAHAAVRKSFNREGVEKGVAVYQVLSKKFYPRKFPAALVRSILAFAMTPPKCLDQLDLWDEVKGWLETEAEAVQKDPIVEKEPESDVLEERGALRSAQRAREVDLLASNAEKSITLQNWVGCAGGNF